MKAIRPLVALLAITACATTQAASIFVDPVGFAANGKYSIYLAGGADNGNFNTVSLDATPSVGTTFVNLSSGAGKTAADANTFRNRVLDGDPLDGGLGWSMVGTATTATSLAFTGGPLGANITTANEPGGRLFLGNVVLAPSSSFGTIRVSLFNGQGAFVAHLNWVMPLAEPASGVMVVIGLLLSAATRRRPS